jgi:signal transduction histidine kinase
VIAANEATLKAKAADRAKSTFLANMAHELRTPLNAIIGFSEIIKLNNIQTKERYPEYAGYIHDAGILLLEIINGILDLARIESGEVELHEHVVGFHELIESVIATVRPICQRKFIDIGWPLPQPPLNIYVDPTKFKKVIFNLLCNGVKFTEPRGRIQIGSVLDDRGDLVISITDTGIGIPPEKAEEMLEPFEQVDGHPTRENEGNGLGLPIARALVKLHGGELLLVSELGIGTTAIVRLPRERVHGVAVSAA